MSVNRENVIWQSADGSWSRAFYEFWPVGEDDEDWDYEWDVEYGSDFNWVSSGWATEEAAHDSWTGANPGGSETVAYSAETAALCEALDAKARDLRERLQAAQAAETERRGPGW